MGSKNTSQKIPLFAYVVVLLFASLSIFVIIFSFIDFPESKKGIPGPRVFPIIISSCMLLSSIVTLYRLHSKNKNTDNETIYQPLTSSFFQLLGIIILYTVLIAYIGFVISTIIFLIVLLKIYTKYTWYIIASFSILVSFLLYFIFNILLNVPLYFGFGIE